MAEIKRVYRQHMPAVKFRQALLERKTERTLRTCGVNGLGVICLLR